MHQAYLRKVFNGSSMEARLIITTPPVTCQEAAAPVAFRNLRYLKSCRPTTRRLSSYRQVQMGQRQVPADASSSPARCTSNFSAFCGSQTSSWSLSMK